MPSGAFGKGLAAPGLILREWAAFLKPPNHCMESLITSNVACLEQGIDYVRQLPAGLYGRTCPDLFGSSVGGHLRHCLDHYAAFLDGFSACEVDYDTRERDPVVERDTERAVAWMESLSQRLEALDGRDLDTRLRIRMDDGGCPEWSATSLRRELQFLLSHSIHHYALMVAVAGRLGHTAVPEGFGVAPSTLRHQARAGL